MLSQTTSYIIQYRWDDDNGERWHLLSRYHTGSDPGLEEAKEAMRRGRLSRPGVAFRIIESVTTATVIRQEN
jgi:hypothetical protein